MGSSAAAAPRCCCPAAGCFPLRCCPGLSPLRLSVLVRLPLCSPSRDVTASDVELLPRLWPSSLPAASNCLVSSVSGPNSIAPRCRAVHTRTGRLRIAEQCSRSCGAQRVRLRPLRWRPLHHVAVHGSEFHGGLRAVQMSKSYSLFNNLLKYRILRIIDLEKFIRELVKRAIFPDILDIGKG